MAYIVIPVHDISKFLPILERMEHYEAQIKVITEDFKEERGARAMAHQRAEGLQEEVKRLKSQLEKQRLAIISRSKRGVPLYECDEDGEV